eukprot:222582-Chlamydomonas_euryale.AAC.4
MDVRNLRYYGERREGTGTGQGRGKRAAGNWQYIFPQFSLLPTHMRLRRCYTSNPYDLGRILP